MNFLEAPAGTGNAVLTEAVPVLWTETDNPALLAREARWHERLRLAALHHRPVLSATLRLPHALRMEYMELLHEPVSCLPLAHVVFERTADGPCLLGVANCPTMDAYSLKTLALALEDSPLGVLFDLDVMDEAGRQLSRDERGLEPRPCLVCGASARECMLAGRHSCDAVRAVVEALVRPAPACPLGADSSCTRVFC